MQNFVPQFNSHDRIAAYWLLQQWRRRVENDLALIPLGQRNKLRFHQAQQTRERFSDAIQKIHGQIRLGGMR